MAKIENISCPFCGNTQQVAVREAAQRILARPKKESSEGQWLGCSGCGQHYWIHVWAYSDSPKGAITRIEQISCPFCGNIADVAIHRKASKAQPAPAKESGDGQWVGCSSCNHSYWIHVWVY